jgi:integrase
VSELEFSLIDSGTVDEARRFLESAREDNDPLYGLWVLILVLGLRRGEGLRLSMTPTP